MSFLDNLENTLKSLESRDEGTGDDNRRRERDRESALAAAPWAERLKKEPFSRKLMQQATVAGRPRRLKVNILWIGNTLRLEARNQRLEMRPEAQGITAVFLRDGAELRRAPVDLAADPSQFIDTWMADLDEQKRLDDARAALLPQEDLE